MTGQATARQTAGQAPNQALGQAPGQAPGQALGYVHGYSAREARRLNAQADSLAALLHGGPPDGTAYPPGSTVLEVGCGVGAQTVHLVANSPRARIVAVDRDGDSLARASARVAARAPWAKVTWLRADLHQLPFDPGSVDHVFLCFVLEHLAEPDRALAELRRLLRPGGTITVIEGDHGSVVVHPDSEQIKAVVNAAVRLQAAAGGNALIGRQLQPLLTEAGYREVTVVPRTAYADATRPDMVRGVTIGTFIHMLEPLRDQVLAQGLASPSDWDRGIADLYRSAEPGGTFHYTFFKARAVR